MPVVSPFVLEIGDSTWDLMKVVRWNDSTPQTTPATVQVFFIDTPNVPVEFNKAVFEAQMQIAMDALP